MVILLREHMLHVLQAPGQKQSCRRLLFHLLAETRLQGRRCPARGPPHASLPTHQVPWAFCFLLHSQTNPTPHKPQPLHLAPCSPRALPPPLLMPVINADFSPHSLILLTFCPPSPSPFFRRFVFFSFFSLCFRLRFRPGPVPYSLPPLSDFSRYSSRSEPNSSSLS